MNKVSYALGLGIGRQLQDLCGEDLNLEDFAQAVKDIYTGGELAIDEIEGQQMVIEYLQRRDAVKKSIEDQGKLTEELSAAIDAAQTLAEVEDLYRPYKQKRRL